MIHKQLFKMEEHTTGSTFLLFFFFLQIKDGDKGNKMCVLSDTRYNTPATVCNFLYIGKGTSSIFRICVHGHKFFILNVTKKGDNL